MSFHYALVDDLLSREEFDRRVEEKEEETGGLLDTHTAAMLVVGELGRSHVKIREITRKASICSFFGKVISIEPPREFMRADGAPGVLARLTLGDETGQIVILLWDERAMAVHETETGDVLEVIGRPTRSGTLEIHTLNIRPSACEISSIMTSFRTREKEEMVSAWEVCLLGLDQPREYHRRDGSTAVLVEGLFGDAEGTYRLICWTPELVSSLEPPCTVRMTGARCKEGVQGREYHLDAQGAIEGSGECITVPFIPIPGIVEGEVHALCGTITVLDPPRSYLKNGEVSWLRNFTLSEDGVGVRIVLWGEKSRIPLIDGEKVAIYHTQARAGRGSAMEIHSMRGTVIHPLSDSTRELVFVGTAIRDICGMSLDNGEEAYLVEGDLPPALHLRVEGRVRGRRLMPSRYEAAPPDRNALLSRLEML
ncbi:MAG: OB-fold nucleic acid binding domain-containing protein [Methanomicrobiales archaeon]|nr:OB-fold nucleic acid binding domain-containing protein [Methanomicrobiales archaeon]